MLIKALRGTVINRTPVKQGQIVEASAQESRLLFAMGKAEVYTPVIEEKNDERDSRLCERPKNHSSVGNGNQNSGRKLYRR
jgi:hypothetical protein